MTHTSRPTVDWQKLFGEHHRRLAPFKETRWKKSTPEIEVAKRQAMDECALEGAHAQLTQGFESLKPGVVWSRPAVLPVDDAVLIWHLRVAQSGKAARASKDIASDFWRWRWSVLEVEREDSAKVLLLMRCIVALFDVRDGLGGELARAHVEFVDAHYGHRIGASHAPDRLPADLPREAGDRRAEFNRLVYQLTRREAVLPTWLAWFGSTKLPAGMRPRGPAMINDPAATPATKEQKDDQQEEVEEW